MSPSVPLLTPSRRLLRADAVWITVCNWADAIRRRLGDALIVTGEGPPLESDSVWQDLFASEQTAQVRTRTPIGGNRLRAMAPARFAESMVSDMRLLRGSRRWKMPADTSLFAGAPFVWQHHDLFHDHGRTLADSLDAPLVQFVDAPVVWEAAQWGVSRGPLGSLVERWGEQPQLRDADLIACVSPQVADVLVRRFSLDPDRVLVTPCTVNVDRFSNLDRGKARDLLGLDEEAVAVGWVGSFRRFHSVDLLLEAFAVAHREEPKLHLVLIGDGPTRTDAEKFVEDHGLGGAASFLGQLKPDDVAFMLSAMDIGVLPSHSQEFHYSPLKLREYAAASLAIVAATVGEVTESLSPNEAVFVAPGSVTELADALTALGTDASRRDQLAQNARAAAMARFDSVYALDIVLEAIERLGISARD